MNTMTYHTRILQTIWSHFIIIDFISNALNPHKVFQCAQHTHIYTHTHTHTHTNTCTTWAYKYKCSHYYKQNDKIYFKVKLLPSKMQVKDCKYIIEK